MAFVGTVAIRAMKDNDYVATIFPGTEAGLQAAVDSLLGGKGKVSVGPGTILTTTPIWLHTGCHLQGSGIGVTVIKRSAMADGDANNSGAVIACGPYGSNGTLYSSGTTGADISISDLTADGNYSAFTITNANLVPSGIRANYVDGLRIHNVAAINTLGTGLPIVACRNVTVDQFQTNLAGQSSISNLGKNAISLIGDADIGMGDEYSLTNLILKDTGDEAIFAGGINNLTINGVSVEGCDFVFELSNASLSTGYTCRNWSISNIAASNALDYFVTFAQTEDVDYENIAFSNCTFSGHATLHDGGAIAFPSTANVNVDQVSFTNCIFSNINSKDTSFHHWVDSQPGAAAGRTGLFFTNCQFYGKSGSTRTGSDVGFNLRGSHTNVVLDNVLMKDVPGTAVRIHDTSVYAATVSRDLRFRGVFVDGANDYAFRITAANASSTAAFTDIAFEGCTAKNSNKQVSGAAFQLFCDQAGASISKTMLRGCRAYKTTGTTLTHGFSIARTAGTVDDVTLENCDFDGVQTKWVDSVTGATGLRFIDSSFKGADLTAATTMALGRGDLFTINGTTQIDAITPFVAMDRRPITFVSGALFVMSTGLGNLTLGNLWAPKVGDTITLRYDGTNWIEVTRTPMHALTYVPTRSAETNLDANVTMSEAQFMRVGKTVTVSGRFTANPTAAVATSFEITLPVASNIGAVEDVAGVAFCGAVASMGAEINGVIANDTAKVQWIATDLNSQLWSYIFAYQVI